MYIPLLYSNPWGLLMRNASTLPLYIVACNIQQIWWVWFSFLTFSKLCTEESSFYWPLKHWPGDCFHWRLKKSFPLHRIREGPRYTSMSAQKDTDQFNFRSTLRKEISRLPEISLLKINIFLRWSMLRNIIGPTCKFISGFMPLISIYIWC